jgi:hypothetical protein
MLDNLSLPNLNEKIRELASRINSGNWFDKEYLPVPTTVQQFIDNPRTTWSDSTQVKSITSLLESSTGDVRFARDTLLPIIETADKNPDIIRYSSLQFLQASHSANRAFNSKLYPTTGEIQNKIQELVGRLLFGGSEALVYNKTIKGFNSVLKVPTVASELGITGFTSNLVPSSDPTIPLLIGELGNLAKFIFSLSGMAKGLEQVAALAAGSIVTKGLSSTGRILAKYQLVNLLKSGTVLLPPATVGVIANSAWLGLMEIAPWVIVAGVIITIVLSESERRLTTGSDFYLFREFNDERGNAFLKYPRLEESQYQAALEALLAYYSTDYNTTGSLTAVVLDQDDPVAGYDLTQKDATGFVRIADDKEAEILWKDLSNKFFGSSSSNQSSPPQLSSINWGEWGPFEDDD